MKISRVRKKHRLNPCPFLSLSISSVKFLKVNLMRLNVPRNNSGKPMQAFMQITKTSKRRVSLLSIFCPNSFFWKNSLSLKMLGNPISKCLRMVVLDWGDGPVRKPYTKLATMKWLIKNSQTNISLHLWSWGKKTVNINYPALHGSWTTTLLIKNLF